MQSGGSATTVFFSVNSVCVCIASTLCERDSRKYILVVVNRANGTVGSGKWSDETKGERKGESVHRLRGEMRPCSRLHSSRKSTRPTTFYRFCVSPFSLEIQSTFTSPWDPVNKMACFHQILHANRTSSSSSFSSYYYFSHLIDC